MKDIRNFRNKMKLLLVLATFLGISHGSYPLSPTNFNYHPNTAGNYNYIPQQQILQQHKPSSIDFSSYKSPHSNSFPSKYLPTSSSTYSSPSSGSYLPSASALPSVYPSTAASSFSILPGHPPSTAPSSFGILPSPSSTSFHNNFPSGSSVNYYSTPPPSNNHQQWPATVSQTFPQWQTPTQSASWPKIMNPTKDNAINIGGPYSTNKFGSSASSNSYQSDESIKAFIFTPTTTVKPPTYSISFSTSKEGTVREATGLRTTNIGNSQSSSAFINSGKKTGQFWKSGSFESHAPNGGGGIISGGPRGQQSIPAYPSSSSPSLYGGRPRGQIQNTEKTQMWSTPIINIGSDTTWGSTGPWKALPQQNTIVPDSRSTRLESTTKSSYSTSSHSSSSSSTKERQEKTYPKGKIPTSATDSAAQTTFADSDGMSTSSSGFTSHLPKESLSLSSFYPGNSQSYQTKERHNPGNTESYQTEERQPRKYNKEKELLSYSDEISNEISDEDKWNESRNFKPYLEDEVIVKKGTFSWKGSDGKLYEIRYTADALGTHFENYNSPSIAKSNADAMSIFSKLNLSERPINIVVSEEQYLQDLQEEPLDSYFTQQQSFKSTPEAEDSSSSVNSIVIRERPTSESLFSSEYENGVTSADAENDRYVPVELLESDNGNNAFHPVHTKSQPEIPEVIINFGTGSPSITSPNFIPLNNAEKNKAVSSPSAAPYSYFVSTPTNNGVEDSLLHSSPPSSSMHQPHGQIKNSQLSNGNGNKKISYAIRHRSKSPYSSHSPNSRSPILQRQQYSAQSQRYIHDYNERSDIANNGRLETKGTINSQSQMLSNSNAASAVPSTVARNMRGYNYHNYNNYDHNIHKTNRRMYRR